MKRALLERAGDQYSERRGSSDRPCVMVVDDMEFNILAIRECLRDDYDILSATSGEECLALLEKHANPDLILLDINMPGMSGYKVCETIKADPEMADIPIIFVTSVDESEAEEKGFELGAVDYVSKPFRVNILSARVKTHITLKKQRERLEYIALHDQLSGLYNRYHLIEIVSQKMSASRRHGHDLSALMIDIDRFKEINDFHGHSKGDAVIRSIAENLIDGKRESDIAFRYGGEEFLVLYDHCSLDCAEQKAQIIRRKIMGLKPAGIEVTISIGAATLRDHEDFASFINRADHALYTAKLAGRNVVITDKE